MAEIDAGTKSPPSPPTDNGDRLDREPVRLVKKAEGGASPITRGGKGGSVPPAKQKNE